MEDIKTNGNDDVQMIPLFQAESTLVHMGYANKRMLIALLSVCVTFILCIVIFVVGYTVREKNWLDTIGRITNRPAVTEVADGIQQQPDH